MERDGGGGDVGMANTGGELKQAWRWSGWMYSKMLALRLRYTNDNNNVWPILHQGLIYLQDDEQLNVRQIQGKPEWRICSKSVEVQHSKR